MARRALSSTSMSEIMSTRSKTKKTSAVPSEIAENPHSNAVTAANDTVLPAPATPDVTSDPISRDNAADTPITSATPNSLQRHGVQPNTNGPFQPMHYGYPPWYHPQPHLMMPAIQTNYNQDMIHKQMSEAVHKAIKEEHSTNQEIKKERDKCELIGGKMERVTNENVVNEVPTNSQGTATKSEREDTGGMFELPGAATIVIKSTNLDENVKECLIKLVSNYELNEQDILGLLRCALEIRAKQMSSNNPISRVDKHGRNGASNKIPQYAYQRKRAAKSTTKKTKNIRMSSFSISLFVVQ